VANNMQDSDLDKKIDERSLKIVKNFLSMSGFTSEKIADNPGDRNQVTPRKYVTRNSTTALRPTSSVLGEFYFDTTVNKPVWWNGTNYQDASGSVV